jgi:hypothetical protein
MNRQLTTPIEQAELKADLVVNSKVMVSFERCRHRRHDTIKKKDVIQEENDSVKQIYYSQK